MNQEISLDQTQKESSGTSILDLSTLRAVRNKFMFTNLPVYGTLLEKPKQTKKISHLF
jgi:hypothetical protein